MWVLKIRVKKKSIFIRADSSLLRLLVLSTIRDNMFLQYFQERLQSTYLQATSNFPYKLRMTFPILRWKNGVKWYELIGLGSKGVWQNEKGLFIVICQVCLSKGRKQSLAVTPYCHQGQGSSSKWAGTPASTLGKQEPGRRHRTQIWLLPPLWKGQLSHWPQPYYLLIVKRNPRPEIQQQ